VQDAANVVYMVMDLENLLNQGADRGPRPRLNPIPAGPWPLAEQTRKLLPLVMGQLRRTARGGAHLKPATPTLLPPFAPAHHGTDRAPDVLSDLAQRASLLQMDQRQNPFSFHVNL